jgi:outer membrane receptor protein involved in Fe transport
MANRNIERAVRVALFAAGAAGAGAYSTAAFAQEQEIEQIVVTGSRIPQPNLEGTSPVSVISSKEVTLQGTQQVEDLINNLPQVFASQGGNYSNGATGTATVDLRGLGSARTLVLINGRRMVAGNPKSNEAPDLNQIPAPLIERVEVLTGGASAVYGSDAVAGVVNFIMKDNFEGVQFDANTSFYNTDNDSDDIASIVAGRGFEPSPNSISSDGDVTELSLLLGSNFADGRGNATVFLGWRDTDALLQSERDYSGCSLGSNAAGFTCGGSGTNATGQFITDNGGYTVDPTTGQPRPYSSATDAYNYGPLNYWQRPAERYSASVFLNYDVTDTANVYSEFMFHDDSTRSQIAPSGIFAFEFYDIPCDGSNPLISAAWLTPICSGATTGTAEVGVARRNVEGGGRIDDIRHTSYRGVLGIKGDVAENWNYDVSALYSQVIFSETYLNDFSITRGGRAMDVVADPVSGAPVCRSVVDGSDPNCVPYNIWSLNGVTQEALDYLQLPLFSKGETELTTVTATMASDLGAYGLKSPMASDGIGVAFGAQYSESSLDFQVDSNFESGDGAGQGGPTIGQAGGYNVSELFAEVRVPIMQQVFMADRLTLNASYRYSDYSDPIDDSTDTYGLGLEWAPISSLMFRGSYQRAVRAPSVIELFQAQGLGLYDNDFDPCAGATPVATLAQCANTGVTAAQYGTILDNTAGQYNALFGGNQELIPETADSYTVGFVWQPEFFEGFSLTVDYFDISVEDVIRTIPPTITLNTCLNTGNPSFCENVQRDARGTLWADEAAQVSALNENIGGLDTSGVDLEVAYATAIGDWGSLSFRLNGTYLDELITTPIAGAGSVGNYDCVGLYGSDCGTPNPEWRHSARITWSMPWNTDLSLGWRYFDAVLIDNTSSNPLIGGNYNEVDRELDSQNYIDIAGSYTFAESYTVRLGINNVMDDEPPLSSQVGSGAGNGNTYPQVYDALGRYVFMGLTAKF